MSDLPLQDASYDELNNHYLQFNYYSEADDRYEKTYSIYTRNLRGEAHQYTFRMGVGIENSIWFHDEIGNEFRLKTEDHKIFFKNPDNTEIGIDNNIAYVKTTSASITINNNEITIAATGDININSSSNASITINNDEITIAATGDININSSSNVNINGADILLNGVTYRLL